MTMSHNNHALSVHSRLVKPPLQTTTSSNLTSIRHHLLVWTVPLITDSRHGIPVGKIVQAIADSEVGGFRSLGRKLMMPLSHVSRHHLLPPSTSNSPPSAAIRCLPPPLSASKCWHIVVSPKQSHNSPRLPPPPPHHRTPDARERASPSQGA